MREYSMCVFAGGMWRGLAEGGGRHGLSESAITPPSLASRSAASHLSPAPWPAACRQALANLPPPHLSFLLQFLLRSLSQTGQRGLTANLTL